MGTRRLNPTIRVALGREVKVKAPEGSLASGVLQARRAAVLLNQGVAQPGSTPLRRAVRDDFQALDPSAQRAAKALVERAKHEALRQVIEASPGAFAASQVRNAIQGAIDRMLQPLFAPFDIPS